MRRHLINRCIDLIESGEGLTKHHHSRLDSEATQIMGREVLFDCDSPMAPNGASFMQQNVASCWRHRRERSVELGFKMKLFAERFIPRSESGHNFHTSCYATTRFGLWFRKLPAFAQATVIAFYLTEERVSKFATRFKWVTGIASFGALAIKVWHSDLISSWWIAISAGIGLAIAFLVSFWN